MKSDERAVVVAGEKRSGRSTLMKLMTSKYAEKRSFISLTQIDFDFTEIYGPSVLQVGAYKSDIADLQLLGKIFKIRNPFKCFFILCLSCSKDRLNFSHVRWQVEQAKAFMESTKDSLQQQEVHLIIAFSKFDLFMQSSPSVQEYNRKIAYSIALIYETSLVSFCAKTISPLVNAAAQKSLHNFLRQRPFNPSESAQIIFEWRAGQSLDYLPEGWAEKDVTLDKLLVELGDRQVEEKGTPNLEEGVKEEEPAAWSLLDALLEKRMRSLSSN